MTVGFPDPVTAKQGQTAGTRSCADVLCLVFTQFGLVQPDIRFGLVCPKDIGLGVFANLSFVAGSVLLVESFSSSDAMNLFILVYFFYADWAQ